MKQTKIIKTDERIDKYRRAIKRAELIAKAFRSKGNLEQAERFERQAIQLTEALRRIQ